jgi:CRP/FNR family transcriptional regulator, dissimilatory nitrate respiration regulator
MKTERRRVPLEEAPVFSGLTPQQKREIEAAGNRRTLAKNKFLFREGERPQGLHVLLSGRMKSSRFLPGGHEVLLHFIEAGQVFGEIPAFLAKHYPASAQAVATSEVFTISMGAFERIVSRQPELAMRLLRGMAQKLAVLLDRIETQKSLRAEERLAHYMVSRTEPSSIRSGAEFRIPMTKRMLAAELGMQPESLSRAFRRLTQSGVISVRERVIVMRDPKQLIELAGGRRANGNGGSA